MTQEKRNTIAENIYNKELKEFIQYIILSVLLFVVFSAMVVMNSFIDIHNPDIFKPWFCVVDIVIVVTCGPVYILIRSINDCKIEIQYIKLLRQTINTNNYEIKEVTGEYQLFENETGIQITIP